MFVDKNMGGKSQLVFIRSLYIPLETHPGKYKFAMVLYRKDNIACCPFFHLNKVIKDMRNLGQDNILSLQ